MFEKQPNLFAKYPEKQPCVVKNCFGNEVSTPVNPFADLQEPLVQQPAVSALGTPGPNLPEKDPSKKNAWGPFQTSSSPVWHYYPRRPGPLLYWQKDRSELTPEEIWFREHPMSPAFKADPIDNRRQKEEPRKPSHGRSEPWYVESE